MEQDEVNKYLEEERLNNDTDGEKGDRTLKCPSCGMDNFAHADGICELDIPRNLIETSKGDWKVLRQDLLTKARGLGIKNEQDVERLVDSMRK